MKFPLRERVFSSVSLTGGNRKEFECTMRDVVDATMDEFDRFVNVYQRRLDRRHWKPVKTREAVTVFKQLSRDPETAIIAASFRKQQPAEARHWPLPKLVGVGTIAGTLDDVMYGLVTPDAPSIVVKSSYVKDDILDSAVLCEMQAATQADPFRYLGLKWVAIGHSAAINAVVWPRDFVFLESTGVTTLDNGDRIGYHAMHSVDHQACPPLESCGLVRSRFSSCYLYRQHREGTVEVYMVSYGDPGGSPPEAIAVMSAANMLIGNWKSTWCAQNKKLAWLLDNGEARKRFRREGSALRTAPVQDPSKKSRCHRCSKSIGSFRSVQCCQLCDAWVCSKCRVTRTLSYSNDHLDLRQRLVDICKSCLVRALNEDVLRIAREQYAEEEAGPHSTPEEVVSGSRRNWTSARSEHDTWPAEPQEESVRQAELLMESHSCESPTTGAVVVSKAETIDDWVKDNARGTPSVSWQRVSLSEYDSLDHQQRLLLKMQTLCLAAEETFQITALTGSYLQEQPTRLKGESEYKF